MTHYGVLMKMLYVIAFENVINLIFSCVITLGNSWNEVTGSKPATEVDIWFADRFFGDPVGCVRRGEGAHPGGGCVVFHSAFV